MLQCSTVLVSMAMIASAMFSACETEPLFIDCPLSPSIKTACEMEQEQTDEAELTCVVAEHPYCLESICASWRGSDPFCSRACEQDADCPADASCQEHLGALFCVPSSVEVTPDPLTPAGE